MLTSDVCYKPARLIEPDMLEQKQRLARELKPSVSTMVRACSHQSHDPVLFRETNVAEMGPGSHEVVHPLTTRPILSDKALRLAGLIAY